MNMLHVCIVGIYIAQNTRTEHTKREVESDSYALTENKAVNVIRCMHKNLVEICQMDTEPCKHLTSYSLLACSSTAMATKSLKYNYAVLIFGHPGK